MPYGYRRPEPITPHSLKDLNLPVNRSTVSWVQLRWHSQQHYSVTKETPIIDAVRVVFNADGANEHQRSGNMGNFFGRRNLQFGR